MLTTLQHNLYIICEMRVGGDGKISSRNGHHLWRMSDTIYKHTLRQDFCLPPQTPEFMAKDTDWTATKACTICRSMQKGTLADKIAHLVEHLDF